MAFVVEKLTKEQGDELREELNLSNPLLRAYKNAEPISPRRKAIDKENDAVVIGIGRGRGEYLSNESEGPGAYYDMFWQGKRVRAIMRVDDHRGKGVFSWVFDVIFVPQSLEAEKDKAVELFKEGISSLREPFEHEKEKYTFEGFVGPSPIAITEDDEVENKL